MSSTPYVAEMPSVTPDRGGGTLEVLGEDEVVLERGGEALDLLGHVRLREPTKVGEHRGEALVELLLERVDLLLVVDALVEPVAVGAVARQLPEALRGLAPVDRLHELGGAPGAGVEAVGAGVLRVEADELDRAAAREEDAADGVLVGVVVHGGLGGWRWRTVAGVRPDGELSVRARTGLTRH